MAFAAVARKNLIYICVGVFLLLTIHLLRFAPPSLAPPKLFWGSLEPSLANATLGFGAIITVSSENTSDPLAWRQKGILAAAKLTGLDVEIAPHREPSFKTIHALQTEGLEPHAKINPALAWSAHLDALEDFLKSPLESALIVEDDTDWDVAVRQTLAPNSPTVSAIRNITHAKLDVQHYYYGLNWDVLWLGHCGFTMQADAVNITVRDQHVLAPSKMRAVLGQGAYRKNAPDSRIISAPAAPMCTFAYGVTRRGAKKLLERRHQGGKGMDFSTSVGCRHELECVSVMPEVFHHHKKLGGGHKPQILRENADEDESKETRSFTQNIKYSARCNAESRDRSGRKVSTKEGKDQDWVQCLPNDADWTKYNQ